MDLVSDLPYTIVDRLPGPGGTCIVSNNGDGPFVDCGVHAMTVRQRVGITVARVKQLGQFVGMVDEDEHSEVVEALEHSQHTIKQQADEIRGLNNALSAYELVVTHKP